MTRLTVKGVTAVDGVTVNIVVEGDEDRAEKVVMDLKERLGRLGAAYEMETPPDELDDIPPEYVPVMAVAWGRVFDNGGDA